MNKKGYTLLFMLAATVLNIVLLIAFFIVGFVLLGLFINKFPDATGVAGIMTLLVFVVSIGATFLIYNAFIKFAVKKWNLEDKLYPFFAPKNRRPKDGE